MVRIISSPRIISAAGTPQKELKNMWEESYPEHRGQYCTDGKPPGWSEPYQTPEFDEYSVVIRNIAGRD
jgi:hypothetical protein